MAPLPAASSRSCSRRSSERVLLRRRRSFRLRWTGSMPLSWRWRRYPPSIIREDWKRPLALWILMDRRALPSMNWLSSSLRLALKFPGKRCWSCSNGWTDRETEKWSMFNSWNCLKRQEVRRNALIEWGTSRQGHNNWGRKIKSVVNNQRKARFHKKNLWTSSSCLSRPSIPHFWRRMTSWLRA